MDWAFRNICWKIVIHALFQNPPTCFHVNGYVILEVGSTVYIHFVCPQCQYSIVQWALWPWNHNKLPLLLRKASMSTCILHFYRLEYHETLF